MITAATKAILNYGLLLLVSLLTGCITPSCVEPVTGAIVTITASAGRIITNWTVLTPTGPNTTAPQPFQSQYSAQNIWLPIDPNASQTRYSVQIDGKTDTLTVRYNLHLSSFTQKCGYGLRLQRPTRGDAATRRLGKVDSVFYAGESGFGNGYAVQPYGLRIRLLL